MSIEHVMLEGHGVRLVKAEAAHAKPLFEITPPDTFRYFLAWPREWTLEAFTPWYEAFRTNPATRMYVVHDAASGAIVGSTSFLDIDASNRSVEVGGTWYTHAARGTHVNPACKLLMLGHAFGALWPERGGCVRVTIKCNALNVHSQRAILKLGAKYEGVLRRHRVQCDGTTRDTMYFSIVPDEWPEVRKGLLARLHASAD